jgi:hypothetical protein
MFNRLHLAQLVFGSEAVDAATSQAAAVLDRWGYRSQARDGEHHRLPGVLAQALLINDSPRLQDLTTEAFTQVRDHPAAAGCPHQGRCSRSRKQLLTSATARFPSGPAEATCR